MARAEVPEHRPTATLVVLAGGTSRRFGSDKLVADVGGVPLLTRCLSGLPSDWELVCVGEPYAVGRPATVVREHPPGSGPAAALVAGVAAATGEVVVTTPGDAPAGASAAQVLLAALVRSDVDAVVGTDADGVDQPLQLAVRGRAVATVASLGAEAAGASARRLFLPLLRPLRVPLGARHTLDIDTVEAARRFRA